MKRMNRVALLLGLALVAATSLEAAEIDHPTDEITNSVLVINNYVALVRVYAEDSQGRRHALGRVARGELKEFEISAEIAQGSFRIRVVPSQPVWSLQQDNYAVKTNPIDLERVSEVIVWLEPDLRTSKVESRRLAPLAVNTRAVGCGPRGPSVVSRIPCPT